MPGPHACSDAHLKSSMWFPFTSVGTELSCTESERIGQIHLFLPVKRDQTLTLGDSCLAFSLLCSAIPTDAQGTLQMWLKLEFESSLYSHGRYLHVFLKECSLKCTVNSFNIHSYYSLIKTLITVTSHWVCPFVFFYLLKISEQIHSFWAQYFCTRLRGFSVYDVLPLSSIKIFWMLCVLSCYCPMTS